MKCRICGLEIHPDWNHCPNCGSPLHPVPSRKTFYVHREAPEKVEQHLTFQQNNYHHFDFGELFRPTPERDVSLPRWLLIASILSIFAVPLVRSWWTLGITSQILLYGIYRCSTDRTKLWRMALLVFLWGVCLFIWSPTGL